MPITLTCAGCRKTLKIPDRLAGKKGRCPACKEVIDIPTPADTFDAEFTEPARSSKQTTPPPDDEFGFLSDPALRDLEAGESFGMAESDAAGAALPPRVAGVKKRRKTFTTAVDEPRPKRSKYKEFTPVEAEPAGSRDHLFLLFALALIPLAITVFFPQPSLVDRVIAHVEEDGGDPGQLDDEQFAEFVAKEIEAGGLEPHLPEDSWMHWGYAGIATVVFLGLLAIICGRSASPMQLLTTGFITGTIGIMMLLTFQWVAFFSHGIWLRGRGIIVILFMLMKFIAFSYYCALDPESGFVASFFGFTFGVGLCEELCKAIPVLWYINSAQSNWKGAMLVGMASGIGFGISEGITYSSDMYNGIAGGQIYLVRFTSCVTLHAVWAGAVGLIMYSDQTYCTDIDWEAALMFVVKYLSIAMILHGLYDVLLKKELEVWALATAIASWMWLAMLFYKRRALEMERS